MAYARRCGRTQLFRLQPSVILHAQLQPLCSAALVPNVLPQRDEGSALTHRGATLIFSYGQHFLGQRRLWPNSPYDVLNVIKINNFRKSNIQYQFSMKVGNWTWSRTMQVVIYFKCLPLICTQMNSFKFDFSKLFWGGSHWAAPQTPPLVFPRTLPSILIRFAPSTQVSPSNIARFAPLIRASTGALGLPPNIDFWIRPWFFTTYCSAPSMNSNPIPCRL